MARLVNLQREIQNCIEKALSNYKKSPKERITVEYLETRLEILENNWNSFVDNHNKLYETCKPEDIAASGYVTSEVYDTTEETYINYKCLLKSVQKTFSVKPTAQPPHNPLTINNKCAVQLPKIAIPTFSGKYSEWVSFRDLFKSLIDKNESLQEVQKLHYLKGCLSGEAAQLVRHTPITDANYRECWSLLEKRYDNKKYLSNCILKRLFGLRRLTAESATSLKELLDTTVDCLNALKNLGIDVTTWDIIIIHIVTFKLDQETRKQWEICISSDEELPTIAQFKTFMEQRFRALEFIEPRRSTNNQNQSAKVMIATKTFTKACEYCSQVHKMCFCKKFAEQTVSQRRDFVAKNNICFNCLGSNHISYDCKIKATCKICHKKHHTLLHPGDQDILSSSSKQQNTASTSQQCEPQIVACLSTGQIRKPKQVLLATALVEAETKSGERLVIRALVDQGSQACFITEAIVQHLRLKKIPANGTISGLANHKTMQAQYKVRVRLQSTIDHNFQIEIEAFVLSKITSYLPEQTIDVINWVELDHLQLADPQYNVPNKIDILLGADVYGTILKEGIMKCPNGALIAQSTTLGWILSGVINKDYENESLMTVRVMHAQINENDILKKFWEVEESTFYSAKKMLNEEEQRCEMIYENTTTRTSEGRYVVNLPFRDEKPRCCKGESRNIAVARMKSLEKRLQRDVDFKQNYSSVLKEYLHLGHMRPVGDRDDKKQEAVYLPHHAVVREDKLTTRVRVVFNASEPNKLGISLNDALMVGPKLQADLRHIVMHWRTYPIALVADIVKMYRQVLVSESDANMYQRIVWRDDSKAEIKDYELLTVTFGTAAAPYLAVKTLQQVAHDEGVQYPLAKERVLKCFYMDDLMTGCESVQEGFEIFKEMQELLNKGGFELQKWNSNDKNLLNQITLFNKEQTNKNQEAVIETEKRTEMDKEEMEIKLDSTIKILGLTWCRREDSFRYAVQLSPMTGPETKRKILSEIAKLFDPLGWVAPSVIVAKIFLQKLWLLGVSWDEPISEELKHEWNTYRLEFGEFSKVQIPRWLGTKNEDNTVELHGFCDASRSAYAAAVYIRIIDGMHNIKSSLVVAKTRVAPVKQVSIPRLELCGAVLLTRLLSETSEVLNIHKDNVHAWTDSTVVLAWLNSHPSRWKTFVGNRVSEIINTLEAAKWSHVSSKQNPADIASRGVLPSALVGNDLWFLGPSFLRNQDVPYNSSKDLRTIEEGSVRTYLGEVTVEVEEELLSRYSSLQKLVRVVAYCRRWLKKSNRRSPYLLKIEIDESLQCCIKLAQRQGFSEEYMSLKNNRSVTKKSSKLRILCPYLDDNGIIRITGRLKHSPLNEDTKTPVVLPHDSALSKLLVAEAHEKTIHGGLQLMLNYLRTGYWVIRAKSLVKQHIRQCVTCVKNSATTQHQFMGALPSVRCTPGRAFLNSAVDYAGPISVRTTKGRGHRSYKGYICVFICMATRAVHLEVVSDMTSQAFIAAFRRFIARRGRCTNMWSDNGTTFVGAAKELRELDSIQSEIAEHLEKNGTEWHFIPPRAPNFGGLWEAAVKSTKYHLKRAIGTLTLTYEEMSTLLTQIEACLNSRPISVINGEDPQEPLPLTPGHFLVGEPLVNIPDYSYSSSNISLLSRWQLVQKTLQTFWKRWSEEYLATLMQRYKWTRRVPEPQVGDIVLIKEDDLPPGQWLLGRVVEVHKGSDNLTRVVTLRTKSSTLKRPTSKLCILPVSED